MKIMYEHVNTRNGKWSPLLADDVYEIIKEVRILPRHPYPKNNLRTNEVPTFQNSFLRPGVSPLFTRVRSSHAAWLV